MKVGDKVQIESCKKLRNTPGTIGSMLEHANKVTRIIELGGIGGHKLLKYKLEIDNGTWWYHEGSFKLLSKTIWI